MDVNGAAARKPAGRREWHAPHYVEKNRQTRTHAALNTYIHVGASTHVGRKFDYVPLNRRAGEKGASGDADEGGEGGAGC